MASWSRSRTNPTARSPRRRGGGSRWPSFRMSCRRALPGTRSRQGLSSPTQRQRVQIMVDSPIDGHLILSVRPTRSIAPMARNIAGNAVGIPVLDANGGDLGRAAPTH